MPLSSEIAASQNNLFSQAINALFLPGEEAWSLFYEVPNDGSGMLLPLRAVSDCTALPS